MKPIYTEITLRGVTVTAVYNLVGCYMPANEIDAAERPVVEGLTVEIQGEDITSLMDEGALETIRERLEESL